MILALDLSSTSTGVCFDGETSTIAPKGTHTHDGDTLTFGCPGCIQQRTVDQLRAAWADMSDDQLYEAWIRCDHTGDTDRALARLLVERGIVSIEEIEAALGDDL